MATEKYVSGAGAGAHDGSSEANAFSWTEMVTDINAGGKAGNRYNYNGSISRTTNSDTITGSGTSTSPIVIRGYSSTIGDYDLGRTNGNGPLVTTNMPTVTYTTGRCNVSTGTFIIIEGISFSGAPSNPVVNLGGADCALVKCKVVNSGTNAVSNGVTGAGARDILFDCDISATGAGAAHAVNLSAVGKCIANHITSTGIGITFASSASVIAANVIYACTGVGIASTSTTGTGTIIFNTIVGGSANAIDIVTATTTLQCIIGNMITDNTGNGVDAHSTAVAIFAANNRTRDNGAAYNSGTDWLAATRYGDVTTDTGGAATDYTNAGGNDYSLIASSPAVNAGIPKYSSIGALQRDQTGASTFIFVEDQ